MHNLGHTRSVRRPDHLLQTPDTFVRAPLPGMSAATAVVHATTALGAKFTQYTAEFEAGGSLGPAREQRFAYVLEGALACGASVLHAGQYAWLPPGSALTLHAEQPTRAMMIEKPYVPLESHAIPDLLIGSESKVAPQLLMGDPALEVRSLLPANASFDLAVNTMTFQPGASLPMVEVHVMEHGLYMLEGGGIYRLGDAWHPAFAGDFIWMAPYLPQWFGALGKAPAKYLIYKDWNR